MTDQLNQQQYDLPRDSQDSKRDGVLPQSNQSIGSDIQDQNRSHSLHQNPIGKAGSFRTPKTIEDSLANVTGYQGDSIDGQAHKNKQSFIYTKKEPATTQKPMARKLRPSQTATQNLQRSFNQTADPAGVNTGMSQNDAETIATNDQTGQPVSPRHDSSTFTGRHVQQDSEVIAQSEPANRKPFKVRKFRSGHRVHGSGPPQYYEDNIDSETEVFFEPEQKHFRGSGLFSDAPSEPDRAQNDLAGKLSNHFKEIDLVLGSNFDEKTKQKMIQEIQQKYRQINAEAAKRSKKPIAQNLRSRTQKKYKMPDLDQDEIFFQDQNRRMQSLMQQEALNRKKKGGYQSLTMQASQMKSAAEPNRKKQYQYQKRQQEQFKGKTAQKQRSRVPGQDLYDQNRHYLMPEVNQFVDHEPTQKHYQTQDESFSMPKASQLRGARPKYRDQHDKRRSSQSRSPHPTVPKTPTVLKHESLQSNHCEPCSGKVIDSVNTKKRESRLSNRGSHQEHSPNSEKKGKKQRSKSRKAEVSLDKIDGSTSDIDSRRDYDSMDQVNRKRKAHFTPGKIRAQKYDPNRVNNYMSPSQQHSADRTPERGRPTKNSKNYLNQSQPDSYKDILPQVKIKQQKRSSSPMNTSSQLRNKGKESRGAISQSINFGTQDLSIPKRQTHFYDNVHGSNVTKVKVEQWKAENDPLRWNAKGPGGPKNRHRIPDPAPIFVGGMSPGRDGLKNSLSPQARTNALDYNKYDWDLDGRRHARPKGKKDGSQPTELPMLSPNKSGAPTQTNIDIQLHHNSSIEEKAKTSKAKSIPPHKKNARLEQLRNDSSIIYVQMQSQDPSKTDLKSNPSKKKQGDGEEVKVVEQIPSVESGCYDQVLESERRKQNKKLGKKLIVEDDFVRPGEYRDIERHRMLEDKAKKNVAKAENKKDPTRRSSAFEGRKPSIASASKKSTKRSIDKSADRKRSIGSSPARNTPSIPDGENRPMSHELDRESEDPYKIRDTQQQKSTDGPPVPATVAYPIKPSTAQTQPNPDVEQPAEHHDGLLKSQEFITPVQEHQRKQKLQEPSSPSVKEDSRMLGSRPDQGDSADNPNAAYSNVPSQPPYLRGQADKPDTADGQEAEPAPENANISEKPLTAQRHPPSIFDELASQEQPPSPEKYYQRPMSGTSTNKAAENAGIPMASPHSSAKQLLTQGEGQPSQKSPQVSSPKDGKPPPFKSSSSLKSPVAGSSKWEASPLKNQPGYSFAKADRLASDGRKSPTSPASPRVASQQNMVNSKNKKQTPRASQSPPRLASQKGSKPVLSQATKKSPRYQTSDPNANSKGSKPSAIESPINIRDDATEGANLQSDIIPSSLGAKKIHLQSQEHIPNTGRKEIVNENEYDAKQFATGNKPDVKSSEGQLGLLGQTATQFGSQVRFIDGHRASDQNNQSQVHAGQRMEQHIGSENSYDAHHKPHSHYTKLVPNDGEVYSQDKSVSYPTGYTKFQHKANVPLKILKQATDNSTSYDFPVITQEKEEIADRAHTTQAPGRRSKITKKNSSGNNNSNVRSATNKSRSIGRQSSQRPIIGKKSDIYVPGNKDQLSVGRSSISGLRNNKLNSMKSGASMGSGAPSSKSPTRKLMEDLTHQRAHIQEDTVILINATEKLTHKGIQGEIHSVGVGFGTGRHTAGMRGEAKKKEVVKQYRHKSSQKSRSSKRTVQQQTRMVELQTTGCEAALVSVKSEILSARQVSQAEAAVSARTQTAPPDRDSVGLSAKELTVLSVKDEGDQVTENRFQAPQQEMHAQTNKDLLDLYLYKEKAEMATETIPIKIDDRKVEYATACIQTEVIVDERDAVPEPVSMHIPLPEEKTARFNTEGDEIEEVASLLSEPNNEEVYPMFEAPPPQEPEETDDGYVENWEDSALYKFVKDAHYDKLVKKGLLEQEKEERPGTPNSQLGMSYQQKFDYNLNPDQLNILSYMEVDYGQSAMRHKSANYCTQEMQQDLFDRSKTTIEVLTMNMVKPDICNHILFTHYKDVTKKNCIKLLLRCKRLYDARNEVVNILKMVIEVECAIKPKSALWRILQDDSPQTLKKGHHAVVMRTLKILGNALTRLTIFNQEHKLFHGEFRFSRKGDYRDYLSDIGAIIGGFLLNKKQHNPSLQQNGQLLDEHDDNDIQRNRYKEWVGVSVAEFGRLDLPPEQLDNILPEAQKKTITRVDIALQKLEEEKKVEEAIKRERASTKKVNKIKVISSQGTIESGSEHEFVEKTVVTDQMIDRTAEREMRAQKLLLMQKQAEEEAGYSPNKPSKQYGLELLKQQLKYDDEFEDQKTDSHKVSEIELKEPVKNTRHESQKDLPYQQPRILNDQSEYQSSSILNTQKNYVIEGDYDHQSQRSELSPIKRDEKVKLIDGLRLNMEAPSAKRSSPRKTKTDRELDVNVVNMADSQDYGSEIQMRVLNTPPSQYGIPSESTVPYGQPNLISSQQAPSQKILESVASEFTLQQEQSWKIGIEVPSDDESIMERQDLLEETLSPTKIDEGRQLSSALDSRPGTQMQAGINQSSVSSVSHVRPGTRQQHFAEESASGMDEEEEQTVFGQESGAEVDSPVKPYGKSTRVNLNDSELERDDVN